MKNKFLFGTATAAFQCEGNLNSNGRGKCIWDDVLLNDESVAKYNPETASNFYNLYEIDFKLANEYGIKSMRISIPWSRIFPSNENDINKNAIEHYHKMFECMKKYKIIPNVTLHHFDSPKWIVDNDDFSNRDNIVKFKKYAEFCFREFDEIEMWGTINEMFAYSHDKFLKKAIPPFHENDMYGMINHFYNMIIAHSEVVKSFKEMKIFGTIGIANWSNLFLPISNTKGSILASDKVNAMYNWFSLEPLLTGMWTNKTLMLINDVLKLTNQKFEIRKEDIKIVKFASENLDWLGINYYNTNHVDEPEPVTEIVHNSTGEKGKTKMNISGFFKQVKNPFVKTTEWDWPIFPEGLKILIKKISDEYKFKKDIYITENGYGNKETLDPKTQTVKDYSRIEYIQQHFNIVDALIKQGINICGYYLWSHMDMFSWTNGYNKRYGLFYVDFDTQKRYPKQSALWWKEKSDSGILIETDKSKKLANE